MIYQKVNNITAASKSGTLQYHGYLISQKLKKKNPCCLISQMLYNITAVSKVRYVTISRLPQKSDTLQYHGCLKSQIRYNITAASKVRYVTISRLPQKSDTLQYHGCLKSQILTKIHSCNISQILYSITQLPHKSHTLQCNSYLVSQRLYNITAAS